LCDPADQHHQEFHTVKTKPNSDVPSVTRPRGAPKKIKAPAAAAPAVAEFTPEVRAVEKVHSPKIAHIVADRLRRQIIDGVLKPGDNIPSEAPLMAQFGISRPALREALRILEAESLIAIGRGIRGGATILKPSIEKAAQYGACYLIANGTTLHDIHAARTLIEPAVAAQLATRPNRELIADLNRVVASGMAALDANDLRSATLATNTFHERLVTYSENKALGLLIGILRDIAVSNYLTYERIPADVHAANLRNALEGEKKLVGLIAREEPEAAEKFWREYMTKGAQILASTGRARELIRLEAPR
jgi:GntR family transcriptional repressor for pyruvate dehydrogenase complex